MLTLITIVIWCLIPDSLQWYYWLGMLVWFAACDVAVIGKMAR